MLPELFRFFGKAKLREIAVLSSEGVVKMSNIKKKNKKKPLQNNNY